MEYSVLKKLYNGTLTTTTIKQVIYTVPANNGPTVIRNMIVHNISLNDTVNFNFYINDTKFIEESIKPQDNLFVGNDCYLVLEPGDAIKVDANKANVLNIHISGSETYK